MFYFFTKSCLNVSQKTIIFALTYHQIYICSLHKDDSSPTLYSFLFALHKSYAFTWNKIKRGFKTERNSNRSVQTSFLF